MFGALAFGGFGCENSYPLIREMIWDFIHTNSERFIPLSLMEILTIILKTKGKIIEEKRNYCKVKIVRKQSSDHILKEKSLWNISKMALK